jgi:uncharacterized membrane protein
MKPPAPALSIAPTPGSPGNGQRLKPGAGAWLTAALVTVLALGAVFAIASLNGPVRLHAPDLALLAGQPVTLLIHMAAALLALAIGIVLMLGVKGTTLHRTLGWIWSLALLTVAAASFLFPAVLAGHFDPIHGLSVVVLVCVPLGIWFARSHRIARHRRMMTNLFMLALIGAGVYTFLPGRLMWRMFFG